MTEREVTLLKDFITWQSLPFVDNVFSTRDETIKHFNEWLIQVSGNQQPSEDCRNCKKWDNCPCGKKGHINETSIGYSIGECKEYEPSEDCVSREAVIEWLKDQDIIKMKWQEENARKELAKLPPVIPKKIYMVCQECIYHKNPSYEKCKECGALMEVE